jgi:MFS family permease
MENRPKPKKKIAWIEFLPAFIIVSNSLVWYTLIYGKFNSAVAQLIPSPFQTEIIVSAFFLAIAFSAILGGLLIPRKRITGLVLWMILGTIMTLFISTIPLNSLPINTLVSILLGVSIGSGLPSALSFFARSTFVENRGLQGGITWSVIGFGILGLAFLVNSVQTTIGLEILAIWRAIGLILFTVFVKKTTQNSIIQQAQSYKRIIARKDLILYLIPWIMFSLINFSETPILTKLLGNFSATAGFVEFAITGIFAIVGGILADRIGRKIVVIAGFVLLGVEYGVLSLFSSNPISWYIYMVFDGASWGMFAVVFFITIWGDLSGEYEKERFYVIGGLPYLLASFLPLVLAQYAGSIQPSAAFSVASFFLFVAVLPLIYAPETLPEKTRKDRDLKGYLEKAQKFALNENKKSQRGKSRDSQRENKEESLDEQESPEKIEAKKLAEKYY